MGEDGPPPRLLRAAGLTLLPGEIRPREGRAWLVSWQETRGLLRQLPAPAPAPVPGGGGGDSAGCAGGGGGDSAGCAGDGGGDSAGDVAWLHAFLARLAGLGFPSPRPLPCFGGMSWTAADGLLWETVSYLPGRVVGWAATPPMEEIGALLGRYHAAARQIGTASQRPSALPLDEVPGVLSPGRLQAAGVRQEQAAVICRLARELTRDLAGARGLTSERIVIHGDFTNHNVLAGGTPPRVTGVIDFALAHAETPLADIGYGLWRSGRPYQEADRVSAARIRRFLAGYASVARLSPEQARVIPVYLRGRGLQMIAKRVRAGRGETGMLAQVQWLSANAGAVGDAFAAAVS